MIRNRINNGTTFKKYTLQIVFFFFAITKYVINITAVHMGILHNQTKSRTKFDAINSLNLNFKRFFSFDGNQDKYFEKYKQLTMFEDAISAEEAEVEYFFL